MNKCILLICVYSWTFPVQAVLTRANDNNAVSNGDNFMVNLTLELGKPLIRNILPNSIIKLEVVNLSANIRFILFQAHSQANKLLISYKLPVINNQKVKNETYVEGLDIGLIVMLELASTSAVTYLQCFDPTNVMIIAQGYESTDPVPGGCNMEFDVEISPYLLLNYDISKTEVKYQRASLGSARNFLQPSCDDSLHYLHYSIYAYFLKENNSTEELYFSALKLMYNFNSIQKNAIKIDPVSSQSSLIFKIPTYRRLGVVFNIVTQFVYNNRTHKAAYIPVVSYGCNLKDEDDSCTDILSVFEWLMAIFGAGLGIFLCFVGHRFFKLSMFCSGFSSLAVFTLIFLARYSNLTYSSIVIITLCFGALGGAGWILFWYYMGSPVLSMTLVGFNLGFLMAAVVFFTPLGKVDVFSIDINYWVLFSCIILATHVICINFAQKYHILSCAIIGAYGTIVLLDRYVAGSLTYIILNTLRRAIDPAFNTVTLIVPFQTTDIILSCVWVFLAGIGVIFQMVREKRKPPFPVSPVHVQRLSRLSMSTSPSGPLPSEEADVWHCSFPSQTDLESLEKRPLLGNRNDNNKPRDYCSTKDEEHPLPYT